MLSETSATARPDTARVGIADILSPGRVLCDVEATSKKAVLERLASLVAAEVPQHTPAEIFDSLIARERLGSTGVGHGVAIPHGRLGHCDRAYGAFMRTHASVDFDAIDRQPVDLFFALLVPEQATDAHLHLLAQLAEMFSDKQLLERLRAEQSPDDLFELLTDRSSNG